MSKKNKENKAWTFMIFLLGFVASAYLFVLEFLKAFSGSSLWHFFLGIFFCICTVLFLVIGVNRWARKL